MKTDDDLHTSHQPQARLVDVDLGCPICGETWLEMSASTDCNDGYATCTAGHRMPTSIWRREQRLRNDKRVRNTSVKSATDGRDLGLPANEGFTGNPKQAPSPPLLDEGVYPFDSQIVQGIVKDTTDRWTASLLFRYQAELLITVLQGRLSPSTARQRELNGWRATCQRTGLLRRMSTLPAFILLLELQEAKRIRRERFGRVVEAARQAGKRSVFEQAARLSHARKIGRHPAMAAPYGAQGAAAEPDRLPHTRDWLKPHHARPERAERPDIWDALAQHYRDKAEQRMDVKAQVDEHITIIDTTPTPPQYVPWPHKRSDPYGHMAAAAATRRTERDAQHAAAEYGGLAPGCCSASSPCNFQKTNPRGICAVCTAAKHQRELDERLNALHPVDVTSARRRPPNRPPEQPRPFGGARSPRSS